MPPISFPRIPDNGRRLVTASVKSAHRVMELNEYQITQKLRLILLWNVTFDRFARSRTLYFNTHDKVLTMWTPIVITTWQLLPRH